MSESPIHIIAPTKPHTHTIILLHGRGSTAAEFASEIFESQASDNCFLTRIFPSYKWVFPCVSVRWARYEEEEMHQWFDMESVQKLCHDPEGIQIAGMRESLAFVAEVVEREAAEIGGLDKVFLGGISQGCATGITALLIIGQPMAGFIGFCGWCPFADAVSRGGQAIRAWIRERLRPSQTAENQIDASSISSALRTPILLQHANDDGVVPIALGQDMRAKLAVLGAGVQWREYGEGGHWINEPEGIDDMVKFVEANSTR